MSCEYWQENYRRYPGADASDGWLRVHARTLKPGMDVLDLGCGAGTNIGDLLGLGVRLSAADFSPNAVHAVQERFGAQLARIDCFDMRRGFPYADAAFDAVVADLSLHYFTWRETEVIAAEIGRVLRQGGRLIARVHSTKNLPEGVSGQIEENYYWVDGCARRYFTQEAIRMLFSAWSIEALQERQIQRYGRIKHILEFTVQKP